MSDLNKPATLFSPPEVSSSQMLCMVVAEIEGLVMLFVWAAS